MIFATENTTSGSEVFLLLALMAIALLIVAVVLLVSDLIRKRKQAKIVADIKQTSAPNLDQVSELPLSALADPEIADKVRRSLK